MRRLLVTLPWIVLCACTPSNERHSVSSMNEVEPNDTAAQATDLGQPGTYLFFGACMPSEPADWYKVTTEGGHVEGSIHVTTPPADTGAASTAVPVDFYLRNSNSDPLAQATGVTDATIDGSVTGGGTIYVQVGCPAPAVAGTNATFYFGTVKVP